jgi:hypothetical protein
VYHIPKDYLIQPNTCPSFWINTLADVHTFLDTQIKKGHVQTIGNSAGNRPIRAVFYGTPRQKKGTTTFSGSLGFRNIDKYLGTDANKKVYLGISGVHGGEFEGIVGTINLLSILETGHDLSGNIWPEITQSLKNLDRIIIIPVLNPDGRARVPIQQLTYRGNDYSVFQYFNTGAWKNGEQIGWPTCKEYIPLDFSQTEFPGGYPNDNGVNIQHDDFFGSPQPETRVLFDLTAQERPDLILSMHTGAPLNNYHTRMYRPFIEPVLMPAWENLYRHTHTQLTKANLQATHDIALESDPNQQKMSVFNLDSALNLHCGALTTIVESPCPGYAAQSRDGSYVSHTAEEILLAQLICHQECMAYLAHTGGRIRWAK